MIKGVQVIFMANMFSGSAENRDIMLEVAKKTNMSSLETFWRTTAITRLLDENPELKVFLDSGAFTLSQMNEKNQAKQDGIEDSEFIEIRPEDFYDLPANKRIFHSDKKFWRAHSKARKSSGTKSGRAGLVKSHDFADKPETKEYLQRYIAFCAKYEKQCVPYVNLDILFNSEKTWENQKAMESNGLHPLPVFHIGEDFKWLTKYVDNYEYLGISGLAAGVKKSTYIQSFGDRVFRYIHESNQSIKIHGFGATSYDLFSRYPFFSTDSTTWLKHAAYGNIMVPPFNFQTGQFILNSIPTLVRVSSKVYTKATRSRKMIHFSKIFTPREAEAIYRWFEMAGVTEEGLGQSGVDRCRANIFYFSQLQKANIYIDPEKYLQRSTSFF
jgi:hypothetical protein